MLHFPHDIRGLRDIQRHYFLIWHPNGDRTTSRSIGLQFDDALREHGPNKDARTSGSIRRIKLEGMNELEILGHSNCSHYPK